MTPRVAIPGGWEERDIRVGKHSLRLVLPRDPDEFVYDAERSPVLGSSPDVYWAQIWSAATDMAELVAYEPWPANAATLELGCGLGLVGLAGATSGLHVTFSDYIPIAVELAVENAHRNGLYNVNGLVLDWRDPPDRQFDVLLASDVLYYAQCHESVLHTIDRLLSPRGVCWIGDAGREPSLRFLPFAREHFEVTVFDRAGSLLKTPTFGQFFLLKCTK